MEYVCVSSNLDCLHCLFHSFLIPLFGRKLQNRSATLPCTPPRPARSSPPPPPLGSNTNERPEVVKAFIFASRRKVILPRQTWRAREGGRERGDRTEREGKRQTGLPTPSVPRLAARPSTLPRFPFPSFTGDITVCFLTSSACLP